MKMLGYCKWKRELEEEDIIECGGPVNRSTEALFELYDIYKKHNKANSKKITIELVLPINL